MLMTLPRPDDWHVHLREGSILRAVLADSAHRFGRVLVMPNLAVPICSLEQARLYRACIMQEISRLGLRPSFNPLMTLYLTDETSPAALREAYLSGEVLAAKLYPAGATTHSQAGVRDLARLESCLSVMEEIGMPLSLHGEVVDADVDVFDREAVFIDRVLSVWTKRFSNLKMVLEHITTEDAVEFVLSARSCVAATITAHHLLLDRNALFMGGLRPHYYCLPILKRERHRLALIRAATSGNPKFFLGTDSAPHAESKKLAACGCAGLYTAHAAIELYAEIFEDAQALDQLPIFSTYSGADFYGLPRNDDTITLSRNSWRVPERIDFEGGAIVPFRSGEWVRWSVVSSGKD